MKWIKYTTHKTDQFYNLEHITEIQMSLKDESSHVSGHNFVWYLRLIRTEGYEPIEIRIFKHTKIKVFDSNDEYIKKNIINKIWDQESGKVLFETQNINP